MKLIVSRPEAKGMAVGICERSITCPGVGRGSVGRAVGDTAGEGNGLTGDGSTSGAVVGVIIDNATTGWKGVGVAVARGLAVIKYQSDAID